MSIFIAVETDEMKEIAEKAAENKAIENKAEAKATANNLKENYPDWKDKLPDCPCTEKEIDKSEFESSNIGLETHHPGAASGYRSSEPVEIKSSVNPKLSELEAGQQCTFDRKGELITHGEGAGTPDAYSPSELSNVLDHYQTDVFASKHLSTEDYQKEWTPNNDNNCPENWGDKVAKPEPETTPENKQPSLDSEPESDRTSPENSQLEKIDPETDTESELNAETNEFESFIDETSDEKSESFLESDSVEVESFAEANSESFESFSESGSESHESFSESGTEMAGESSSELATEMA